MGNTALPRVGDAQLQRLIQIIETALNALESSPFAGAVLITQAIGVTDTRVYTGLGRAVSGYFPVRSTADVRVFDGAVPETVDSGNYVSLRASSAQTVTLAVY